MSLAALHPQIVHFAVALLLAGVLLRWVSLSGRMAFSGPAAVTLLFAGTLAAVLAVQSGRAAHGPVERVPGVRAAVQQHEEWGQRTRNIFLAVAALEILALVPAVSRRRTAVLVASALVGLAGAVAVYEAGAKGGALVYEYAGGVGIRSGDPADVARLLVAGLYQQAMLDRAQGRPAAAAQLITQLAQRYPEDTSVRLLAVESLVLDRKDGRAALAALQWFPPTSDSRFLRFRVGILRADAYAVAGMRDSTRAVLQALSGDFANNPLIADRIEKLK
jgi:uncharacterized membrane protein